MWAHYQSAGAKFNTSWTKRVFEKQLAKSTTNMLTFRVEDDAFNSRPQVACRFSFKDRVLGDMLHCYKGNMAGTIKLDN